MEELVFYSPELDEIVTVVPEGAKSEIRHRVEGELYEQIQWFGLCAQVDWIWIGSV